MNNRGCREPALHTNHTERKSIYADVNGSLQKKQKNDTAASHSHAAVSFLFLFIIYFHEALS